MMPREMKCATGKAMTLCLVAALLAFSTSGCITSREGSYVGREELHREIVPNGSYSAVVEYDRSPDGAVVLRLFQDRIFQVTYAKQYQKIKNREGEPWAVLFAGGTAGALVGAVMAPECFWPAQNGKPDVPCETPEEKMAISKAVPWLVGGSVAALAGLFGGAWSLADSNGVATDELITGERYNQRESAPRIPLADEPVVLRINGQRQEYVTDETGRVTIYPGQNFGLHKAESPRPILATIVFSDHASAQTVTLDPTQWMKPRFRITESRYLLREQPSREARPVGQTRVDDVASEVRVKSRQGNWVKTTLHGITGWVHQDAGEVFWAAPTYLDPTRLPALSAEVAFQEPSGNRALDAAEEAQVVVTVTNEGDGPAYRVRARVTPGDGRHLKVPPVLDFGTVPARSSKTEVLPIKSERALTARSERLEIAFREANGFEPPPTRLEFETRAFRPPRLSVADVGIEDAGHNGQIDPGELITVTVRIRNTGAGVAKDVRARVRLGENVFSGPDFEPQTSLGTIQPGASRDIRFAIYTNQRATEAPVFVDLSESYGEFGAANLRLPLPFSRPIGAITEHITPTAAPPLAGSDAPALSVDVWQDLPATPMDNPDAVAVVIGVRDYLNPDVPDVAYARRDAALMRRYLTGVLGFRPENILPRNPDQVMTAGMLKTLIRHRLPDYLRRGTDVFVYFSGHGAPSTGEDPQAYLVPADADPNFVSNDNAYRLARFYEDLVRVARDKDAGSLTVVLDACFTGQSGSGEMLIRQASPLTLTVENPLLLQEQATAFVASGRDEVANWYPEKRHGMFTYFFLKGLKGAADLDGDRRVTVEEMQAYLSDDGRGVPYWSRRIHGRAQTPQVQARDAARVLVRYE